MDYLAQMENVEVPQENKLEVVKAIEVISPIARSREVTGKRTFLYAMETK